MRTLRVLLVYWASKALGNRMEAWRPGLMDNGNSVMESDPIVYKLGEMINSVIYPSIRIWNYDRML